MATMKTHNLQIEFNRAQADTEARTVPAVLSTEYPVTRSGYSEVLSHQPGAVDTSRFPLPVIESHDGNKVNIGIVENPQLSGGKLRGTVRFGQSARAQELFADIQAGIVTNLSIGYQWLEYQDSGNTTVVTRWRPFELSIVSIPADPTAGFYRNLPMTEENQTATGADDQDATITREAKRGMTLERKRQAFIRSFGEKAGVEAHVIDRLINKGVSDADAQAEILEIWSGRVDSQTSRSDTSVTYSRHYTEGFGGHSDVMSAMADGLLLRSGVRVDNPHVAARDFAHVSIREIASMLLRDRGDYASNQSPAAIIKRAMSTSDLPALLENVANKAMITGFEEAPQTHDAFCNFVDVTDFKTQSRIALSAFESLDAVPELGAVTYSGLTDSKETYSISSYQKAIAFSRQSLINDDLSELTTVPRKLGSAARRTEADLVYSIFTGNPNMADSVALFAASRGNLLTSGTSALSATSLALAVVALRKAKDISGSAYLGIRPKWLIVPPELEITALQVLASLANTKANANAIPDSDMAKLTVIVEPRLTSATAWFLLGQGVETIEVGRLSGNGISFETDNDFSTDAWRMKVRLDAGAKALSPLAMVKANGA